MLILHNDGNILYVYVWLLGRSSCSSYATKEHHQVSDHFEPNLSAEKITVFLIINWMHFREGFGFNIFNRG